MFTRQNKTLRESYRVFVYLYIQRLNPPILSLKTRLEHATDAYDTVYLFTCFSITFHFLTIDGNCACY